MCSILSLSSFVLWLVAAGFAGDAWRRLRRREREELAEIEAGLELAKQVTVLHEVMFHLACRSFLYQHLPIWRAWSDATGIRFQVSVDDGKQ